MYAIQNSCVIYVSPSVIKLLWSLYKNLLHSVTILEANPFEDTENHVCVVCFDGVAKPLHKVAVFKNDCFITSKF